MKIEELIAKLPAEIRKLLSKQPMSEGELADALDVSPAKVRQAIGELRSQGLNISNVAHGRLLLNNIIETGGHRVLKADKDGWHHFGFTTDNHLASKKSRLDVLNAAYDHFEREGIKTVLNAGNAIEGEARFNKQELLVWGMERQVEYWIEQMPVKKDMETLFVTGDDHEGWYAQRECINIGSFMQSKAEQSGRKDLQYLGHVEADIELQYNGKSTIVRPMHPGGGSAYALSYAPQKIVESFQGGEKPSVLFIGHYHKFDYCYPREVHVVSGGCTCDQTMFMRKNKIAAHVGYMTVRIKQAKTDGHVERVLVEWVPFYDRGYYRRDFE